jgi:hypothetical protein
MSRYTFVVEYEDGKEPAIGSQTDILGGRLCYVAFDDIRQYQLSQEEAQAITLLTDENEDDFYQCCAETAADPDEILEKLKQQAT